MEWIVAAIVAAVLALYCYGLLRLIYNGLRAVFEHQTSIWQLLVVTAACGYWMAVCRNSPALLGLGLAAILLGLLLLGALSDDPTRRDDEGR